MREMSKYFWMCLAVLSIEGVVLRIEIQLLDFAHKQGLKWMPFFLEIEFSNVNFMSVFPCVTSIMFLFVLKSFVISNVFVY